MNLTNKESIAHYFCNNEVEFVIHLVAVASIPKCESNKKLAWDTNVQGTRNILEASQMHKVKKFLYLQSACIFSGEDVEMYNEDSLPDPKHYYGLTKLIAEEIVKTSNTPDFQTVVVRTNFTTMPWEYPKAFTDRFGTYLFAQ
ncbi:MAG: NAD-dependent epimerase/dehydratase family protein [Arcicella sp.]|nr:NAD-dependent epimerase/dehydratase family protein [Arcicella sp.]